MPSTPATLPILERKAEIVAAIRAHQVVVICGETGSGKTTQLPQICLELGRTPGGAGRGAGRGGGVLIGHTQPRRLAARSVAARIAEERGERLGERGAAVGVKVRFQDQTTRDTRIKVMTDGVLLAELAGDRDLAAYGTIIIDEAHERSLNIDFLLGYLRTLLPRRPDLKLVVTSATIDPHRFARFFADARGAPAPVIEVSGRTYPVEVRYHDVGADGGIDGGASADEPGRLEVEAVADAVEELTRGSVGSRDDGDVLVFLPGEREIRSAWDAIGRRLGGTGGGSGGGGGGGGGVEILPLFSRLTNEEQDRIFHRPVGTGAGWRRRVILATNVAETSLTVPGIRYVVDTGLARLSRYDAGRKVQRLPIEAISRASADQRSGRCGRVSAGVCVRLYSKRSYESRPAFTDPEIRRTNLASVILRMKSLDLGAIEDFAFLDPPDPAAIKDGYETLFELGAIAGADGGGWASAPLTEIGVAMARVPAEPRVARMLMGAEREGCVREALVLAAALSIQDPRERPLGRQEDADRAQVVFREETSDFLTLLRLWDQYQHALGARSRGGGGGGGGGGGDVFAWCREHFVSAARMREWQELHRQLREIADDLGLKELASPAGADAIHRALLTGLISNAACREAESGSFDYRGVRGNVVNIFPGSVLFKKGPKWIMAAEVVQTTRLYARTIAKINVEWIEELAGHMFRRQYSDPHLDPDTGEPSAWERVTMSGIVVVPRRRAAIADADPGLARTILLRDGLARGLWKSDAPFMRANRETLARARSAEAKLRRRGILRSDDEIAAWFASVVPDHVRRSRDLDEWRRDAEAADPGVLELPIAAVVKPDAAAAFDASRYPDAITLEGGGGASVALSYALAPGKDEDGVTATVPLACLPMLTPARAAWLVPGMLTDLVLAMVKSLPKGVRAGLEARASVSVSEIAESCAGVLTFGEGELDAALAEAVRVLYDAEVPPSAWAAARAGVPACLRLRVRVVDESGKELAADRGVDALQQRFAARLTKLQAARDRAGFERDGLVSWDFDALPERIVTGDDGGPSREAFAALVDRGESVALTVVATPDEAARLTHAGIRRLFAIACGEEVGYSLASLPAWREMVKQYATFGGEAALRAEMACLIAERVFLAGQPPIRTRSAFDARSAESWGRLSAAAREVGDVVARILEPRAKVAHRISSGTPRIWADSVADIREHAAYLMPRGFLLLAPWEHLRHYPRYVGLMRDRLFALREDGKQVEADALRAFLPWWKRFTGWVSAAMSEERAAALEQDRLEAEQEHRAKAAAAKAKAPLPATPRRRNAPVVNLDAGEWAMQPGRMPPAVERYRWALEEWRLALFTPGGGEPTGSGAGSPVEVQRLWRAVEMDRGSGA